MSDSSAAIRRREAILSGIGRIKFDRPSRGSSFFVSLTELCPVACLHCIYSSTLVPKSHKYTFDRPEMADVVQMINDSRSECLTISGGGEPFLRQDHIQTLLRDVRTETIELHTAGHWAQTPVRAAAVLARIRAAARKNSIEPKVRLRLSFDRFHVEAPNGVAVKTYANVARVWQTAFPEMDLGYRCLERDRDVLDRQLAAELGGRLEDKQDGRRYITLPDGAGFGLTYAPLRFAGSGEAFADEFRQDEKSIREHFAQFEQGGRFRISSSVYDSLEGVYRPVHGVAVTLDSNGLYWIFGATAPDRRLLLGHKSFAESLDYFFADPVTVFCLERGIWSLAALVDTLSKDTYDRAVAKNDIAFLVEDLLEDPNLRLQVTIELCSLFDHAGRIEWTSAEIADHVRETASGTFVTQPFSHPVADHENLESHRD